MDKRAEKQALHKVFGSRAERAKEHERPDFIIKNDDFTHGIEVTELYATAIDAKLLNVPSYISDVLQDSQNIHRKDRDTLRVESITIERKDGTGKIEDVRAIFQRNPAPIEKFKLLSETVDEKSAKHAEYLRNCNFADLIVCDKGYLFCGEQDVQILVAQLAEDRDFLARTPFREIFVLGQATDQASHFYFPVRGNVFLIDTLLLDNAFLDSGGHINDPRRLITLARCLREIGHKISYESPPSESIHIPGWQIILDGLNVSLRQWTDLPNLQSGTAAQELLDSISATTIREILDKRLSKHCTNTFAFQANDT